MQLLTHNVAEYCPTDVVATQGEVLAYNMAAWRLTRAEWDSVRECPTSLWSKRLEPEMLIHKKPAASKRAPPKFVKRHTFNKVRAR